jgi:hypothetical protein
VVAVPVIGTYPDAVLTVVGELGLYAQSCINQPRGKGSMGRCALARCELKSSVRIARERIRRFMVNLSLWVLLNWW